MTKRFIRVGVPCVAATGTAAVIMVVWWKIILVLGLVVLCIWGLVSQEPGSE